MTGQPGKRNSDPIELQRVKTDFDIACANLAMATATLKRAQDAVLRARQRWIDVRDGMEITP